MASRNGRNLTRRNAKDIQLKVVFSLSPALAGGEFGCRLGAGGYGRVTGRPVAGTIRRQPPPRCSEFSTPLGCRSDELNRHLRATPIRVPRMNFEKWQALGNDYIILEAPALPWELTPARIVGHFAIQLFQSD